MSACSRRQERFSLGEPPLSLVKRSFRTLQRVLQSGTIQLSQGNNKLPVNVLPIDPLTGVYSFQVPFSQCFPLLHVVCQAKT